MHPEVNTFLNAVPLPNFPTMINCIMARVNCCVKLTMWHKNLRPSLSGLLPWAFRSHADMSIQLLKYLDSIRKHSSLLEAADRLKSYKTNIKRLACLSMRVYDVYIYLVKY